MKLRFSLLIAVIFLTSCSKQENKLSQLVIETSRGEVIYEVETATTPEEMQKGLMFRKSLPENQGMIFSVYPVRPAIMWMKNTLIPLDMLFVSEDGSINQIISNAEPQSEKLLGDDIKSRAVIELNGGQAEKHNIQIGDIVRHKILGNER